MLTQTMKAHYLTNSMKGFENYFRTRITSVERYSNEPETLYIYMWVNPTTEVYTDVERIETTVIYNLVDDTYKIKLSGKGSRKYGQAVKWSVQGIIDHLAQEAEDTFKGDCADALFETQCHYHEQLKTAGAEVSELNEFYACTQRAETAQEIEMIFTDIMGDLGAIITPPEPSKITVKTLNHWIAKGNVMVRVFTVGNRYSAEMLIDFDRNNPYGAGGSEMFSHHDTLRELEIGMNGSYPVVIAIE